MKPLVSTLALAAMAALLNACYVQVPISNAPSQNNQTYEVAYLFEHDGCKVYRFRDQGNWVYFTNCSGEATTMKNDTTSFRVITSSRRDE
jgi:hypothetical protein